MFFENLLFCVRVMTLSCVQLTPICTYLMILDQIDINEKLILKIDLFFLLFFVLLNTFD